MQIAVSPYFGPVDLARLQACPADACVDRVSLADILRNSFVYPPHSIFEGVKLATLGFDPAEDLATQPRFHFPFAIHRRDPALFEPEDTLVSTYHRLLCEAVSSATAGMQRPWLLQSGGKDSTSLAIAAADARPDTVCITYMGGREENELASAAHVADTLGLRHETLVCDVSRAYQRYLAIVARMPMLTADFALLSYVDLATEIAGAGGDGIVDGLGSDLYFGMPVGWKGHLCHWLAQERALPPAIADLPGISRSFPLCFLLGTAQMDARERYFPGSRFTDAEVDALFGEDIARQSKARLATFEEELASMPDADAMHVLLACVWEPGAYGKGQYPASALSLNVAYPFCDRRLSEWVHRRVPTQKLVDPASGANKVLVREHIATRFTELPYVTGKGCFRFDLVGLARACFDQVHAFAVDAADVLPGAARWLENARPHLGNKYHASKFYLLAVVLPWLLARAQRDDAYTALPAACAEAHAHWKL